VYIILTIACVCIVCHVELRPWCTSDASQSGFVCVDNNTISLASQTQCGLYAAQVDVATCTALNVTLFRSTDRPSLNGAVSQYINRLPSGAVLTLTSSCGVAVQDVRGLLQSLGVYVGQQLPGAQLKVAVIAEIGYRSKTRAEVAVCATPVVQLCVDVTGKNKQVYCFYGKLFITQ
jgi:hypothetical protein